MSIYRLSSSVQYPSFFFVPFSFSTGGGGFGASSKVLLRYLRVNPSAQPKWQQDTRQQPYQSDFSKTLLLVICLPHLFYFCFLPLHICVDSWNRASTAQPPAHHSNLDIKQNSFCRKRTLIFTRINFILENLNPSVRFSTQGAKKGTTSITLRGFSVVRSAKCTYYVT